MRSFLLPLPALLAVLAASVHGQFTFTPPGQIAIDPKVPTTSFKIQLAAAPQGDVVVYLEAPNINFGKCEYTFTTANYNQPQQVDATAQPVFTADFPTTVPVTFMGVPKVDADKTAFATNGTYSLTRDKSVGGICKVWNDPHFQSVDGLHFDFHIPSCQTLLIGPDMVIQTRTVMHQAKPAIALTRDLAVFYGGNVLYWSADKDCSAASPATLASMGVSTDPPPVPTPGKPPPPPNTPNTANYIGTFHFSNGACITATNSMVANGDGRWAMNLDINLPTHFFNKIKGLCGNYDGNSVNDNTGSDGKLYPLGPTLVAQPDGSAFGTTWECTPDLNLFECKNTCPGLPKAEATPNNSNCQIATSLAADTPRGYGPPMQAYVPGPPPTAVGGAPPAVDPAMQAKATASCNLAFSQNLDCAKAFQPFDTFLGTCMKEAVAAMDTNFVQANVLAFGHAMDTATQGPATQADHPQNTLAIDCRRRFGLGNNQCPNDCGGPQKGSCTAKGCICLNPQQYAGVDCGTQLPPPPNGAAAAAGGPAPALLAAAPVVAGPCTGGDMGDYAGSNPVSFDNCHTHTGDPGIFDQDSDGSPGAPTQACVCADRGPGDFCLNVPNGAGAMMHCTGDDSAQDNQYIPKCTPEYASNTVNCFPTTSTPTGPGHCSTKKTPFAHVEQFDKLPCDYFPAPPAGQKRAYCAGRKGDHLLICPDNKVSKCASGCVSKYEIDKVTPCGKAACAGGQGY